MKYFGCSVRAQTFFISFPQKLHSDYLGFSIQNPFSLKKLHYDTQQSNLFPPKKNQNVFLSPKNRILTIFM